MGTFINDFKSFGRTLLFTLLAGGGVMSAVKSLDYGVSAGSGMYIIAGILCLVLVGYSGYSFFKKHFM